MTRTVGSLLGSAAAGLTLWWFGRRRVMAVALRGVTSERVALYEAPDGPPSALSVPEGIVLIIDQHDTGGWYHATIPASISDVLFDRKADTRGWVPADKVTDIVKEQIA